MKISKLVGQAASREMQALIIAPSTIFANVHGEKAFRSSLQVLSANSSCRGLHYDSFLHRQGIHCLPLSNSEVGTGVETVKSKVPGTDWANVACLRLQLEIECQYGEQFLVAGNDPILGSWNPSNAISLSWSEGHIWTVDLELPIRKTIQYKFIRKLGTGDIIWQPGANRIVRLGAGQNVLIVGDDWDNPDSQRIFVNQQENPKINEEAASNNKNFVDVEDESESLVIYNGASASNKDERRTEESRQDDAVESLVNYDEGHVLVPGLSAQMITEEALAEELQKSILANSVNGGAGESIRIDEADAPPR